MAVLDGKIHAVGGRGVDNTFTVGTHEVLDPATGNGASARRCRRPRDHMALVAVDGKMHAIGGRVTNPASRVADARHLRSEDQHVVGRRRRCRPRAAGSPTRSIRA